MHKLANMYKSFEKNLRYSFVRVNTFCFHFEKQFVEKIFVSYINLLNHEKCS